MGAYVASGRELPRGAVTCRHPENPRSGSGSRFRYDRRPCRSIISVLQGATHTLPGSRGTVKKIDRSPFPFPKKQSSMSVLQGAVLSPNTRGEVHPSTGGDPSKKTKESPSQHRPLQRAGTV